MYTFPTNVPTNITTVTFFVGLQPYIVTNSFFYWFCDCLYLYWSTTLYKFASNCLPWFCELFLPVLRTVLQYSCSRYSRPYILHHLPGRIGSSLSQAITLFEAAYTSSTAQVHTPLASFQTASTISFAWSSSLSWRFFLPLYLVLETTWSFFKTGSL